MPGKKVVSKQSTETKDNDIVRVRCDNCTLAVDIKRKHLKNKKSPILCCFCDHDKKAELARGIALEAAGLHSEYDY